MCPQSGPARTCGMPTDMCGQTRPWTPEKDQQHQTPQVKITISPLSVGRTYNIEYKSPCPYESYQMAAMLASTKITHGKSSELFPGDRDMHGPLEISGPNHPKGGVQYRNQGPIYLQPARDRQQASTQARTPRDNSKGMDPQSADKRTQDTKLISK